jgi:hypothetical protein
VNQVTPLRVGERCKGAGYYKQETPPGFEAPLLYFYENAFTAAF